MWTGCSFEECRQRLAFDIFVKYIFETILPTNALEERQLVILLLKQEEITVCLINVFLTCVCFDKISFLFFSSPW